MKEDKLNNDVSNQIPNSYNTQLKYQILLYCQIVLEHSNYIVLVFWIMCKYQMVIKCWNSTTNPNI